MFSYGSSHQFLQFAGPTEVVDNHSEPLSTWSEAECRCWWGVGHVHKDRFHCIPGRAIADWLNGEDKENDDVENLDMGGIQSDVKRELYDGDGDLALERGILATPASPWTPSPSSIASAATVNSGPWQWECWWSKIEPNLQCIDSQSEE